VNLQTFNEFRCRGKKAANRIMSVRRPAANVLIAAVALGFDKETLPRSTHIWHKSMRW
jgi:hypothetical protein